MESVLLLLAIVTTESKWLSWLNARNRFLIAIAIPLAVSGLLPNWLHLSTRLLCLWDIGTACFLVLSAWVSLQATPALMRRSAQRQDEGRLGVLVLTIAAACASQFAIGFMLHDGKNPANNIVVLHLVLALLTIIGSWLLVHTTFAFHYAYRYYRDSHHPHGRNRERHNDKAGGLEFPNTQEPDYWDFLYYSFVIGMTSQVSDVDISSRSLRRLTLIHSVLAFFFNTAILAMSINIVAGII